MGTDARVRYTKMVIRDSLVGLLREKPLSRITVKELCERAEVNRATFYKYYCDVYDLMEKLEQAFMEELLGGMQEKEFRPTLHFILTSIQANGALYQALFSENGDPHFLDRLLTRCFQGIELRMPESCRSLPPSRQRWLYYFVAQGCRGIISQWMQQGMQEPVEEVEGFAAKLVQGVMERASA